MMKYTMKMLFLLCLIITGTHEVSAQKILYTQDEDGKTLNSLRIQGDKEKMEWLIKTDGSQYAWVTQLYEWGRPYYDADGYVAVNVERRMDGDDLVETYTFANNTAKDISLKNIGIYTPFNDNYPDADICMTQRCNVHVWAGGKAAYVNAVRMNGKGPHLGLMVTEGEITDYEVWEHAYSKGSSNFRGVLALCPPDTVLGKGECYRLSWRIFSHNGDFDQQVYDRGGMLVNSLKFVYELGQTAQVGFRKGKETKLIDVKVDRTGEIKVDYEGAYALLYGINNEKQMIANRARFIVERQQYNNPDDVRDGAFMIYDNEGDSIVTDDKKRSDLSEGRERVGMGVFLAEYCRRNPDMQIQDALVRYAKFVRTKLQDEDYTTWSNARDKGRHRGYNYAWVADFYFRMSLLTGEKQYALDGFNTLRALYKNFGYDFYCIDYPVTIGLEAMEKAGLEEEREVMLSDFKRCADFIIKNSLHFPKFEVNYEQSIIAPAVQTLCEVYLATNDRKYLHCADLMMPALEAFSWHQPSFRQHEMGMRHWDGYWFGKNRLWGDTYPHSCSGITAAAYHYYTKATKKSKYHQRAKRIVRNCLSLFTEDGRATCAFVFPRRVNGKAAHVADPYANDQDWALVYYYTVFER